MVVCFHNDAEEFERIAAPFLLSAEGENNLMLGLIRQIAEGAIDEFWLASIENDEGVVGCALQTPPQWVLLTRAPAAGIQALVGELVRRDAVVPGVIGPVDECEVFAETWCWKKKTKSKRRMGQGVYRLDQVIPPRRPAPGRLRVIAQGDVEQVALWHAAFLEDTGIPGGREGRDVALQHIETQSLYLWDYGGKAVSMAAFAGPTPNGIRVNLVYTPPECRGHGFASTCVAEMSQLMLDRGRKCCFLYTDLDNPTSNAIYQAIGYRKVAESVVLEFD